ncbi:MAG: class I SAM-dependent methyltransferase [Acidobacteriaceae bacterium]|nr:class I SAM-dependent methyltransferase [Acidobacteriaceae bacterium]MBV9780489.1 class I SAM-dependent methyltransferase [Acidobacteriaceae bacterium]
MLASVSLVVEKVGRSLRRKGIRGTLDSCLEGIEDVWFDRRFGVQTLEAVTDRRLPAGPAGIAPTKIRRLRWILRELPVAYQDFVFVDLGSGKGRALLMASEFPFQRIIGVELLPELISVAQKNIHTYSSTTQKCKNIDLICCDAARYELPSEKLVLFLSNPFERSTVSRVLSTLTDSLQKNPRPVYIVYQNPVCHDSVVGSGFAVLSMTRFYTIYTASSV